MTQEEKQILLKDLCARVPYGVKIYTKENGKDASFVLTTSDLDWIFDEDRIDAMYEYDGWKPYLRPLSSMTGEEKEEMHNLLSPEGTAIYENDGIALPINHCGDFVPYEFMDRIIQYLLEHHFDYRGLIEKGLALEALEDMYKI